MSEVQIQNHKTTITAYGLEMITVERTTDEFGILWLKINTEDGTKVRIQCGRFNEDAYNLKRELEEAAAYVQLEIIEGWEDRPDDSDAYVFCDRGYYYARLERDYVGPFPTREIATYELAALMSKQGYYPNAWYEGERGGYDDIGDEVRAFHDEGGDGLKSLIGVQYEPGDEVIVRPDAMFPDVYTVAKDYGHLGITLRTYDDTIKHADDRSQIERAPSFE